MTGVMSLPDVMSDDKLNLLNELNKRSNARLAEYLISFCNKFINLLIQEHEYKIQNLLSNSIEINLEILF